MRLLVPDGRAWSRLLLRPRSFPMPVDVVAPEHPPAQDGDADASDRERGAHQDIRLVPLADEIAHPSIIGFVQGH